MIHVGGSLAYVGSRKQMCVTDSPTECKLVGLTDYLGFVELLLSFLPNEPEESPVLYQDNTSVLSLVTHGGGETRTKHLRAGKYLCMEAVQEGRVKVVYNNRENFGRRYVKTI